MKMQKKLLMSFGLLMLVGVSACYSTTSRGLGEFRERIVNEQKTSVDQNLPLNVAIVQKPTPDIPLLKFEVSNPNRECFIRTYEKLEKTQVTTNYKPLATSGWIIGGLGLLYFLANPQPEVSTHTQNELDSSMKNRQFGLGLSLGGLGAILGGTFVSPSTAIVEKPTGTFDEKTTKELPIGSVQFTATINNDKTFAFSGSTDDKGKGMIEMNSLLSSAVSPADLPEGVTLDIKLAGGEAIQEKWTLEEALALIDATMDWSQGTPKYAPYPVANLETIGNKAGESITLKLAVSNKNGKGDCFRLKAKVTSAELLFNKVLLIGRVKAGADKTVKTSFDIPKNWIDHNIPITVTFEELNKNIPDPLEANLMIKGLPRPAFAYSSQVIDDGSGNSVGNGDGRIQKGEGVDLLITVKNIGQETAHEVNVAISSPVLQGIKIYTDSASLGDMPRDAAKSCRLNVQIKKDTVIDKLPLNLVIKESGWGVQLNDEVSLPLDAAVPPRVIVLNKRVYVTNKVGEDIQGGAGSDTGKIAHAPEGSALDVIAQLNDWLKVKISDTEFGWIAASAVSDKTDRPVLAAGPPIRIYPSTTTIAVFQPDKDDLETTEENIELSGLVIADKKVKEVTILVDNKPLLAGGRGIEIKAKELKTPAQERFAYKLSLNKGPNEIKIVAVDNDNNTTTKIIKITRVEEKGEVFVLAIGISKYQDVGIKELPCAEMDAQAIYDFYVNDPKTLARKENVSLLLGKDADAKGIKMALEELGKRTKESDMVICYYAGHGDTGKHPKLGVEYYMIPQDAVKDRLFSTAIELSELQRLWGAVVSKRKVFIADCCNSGGFADLRGEAQDGFERGMGEGTVVLTASSKGQKALESAELKHGLFTYYLLEGLKGKADTDGNNKISISEIDKYLKTNVAQKAREMSGVQTPASKVETTGEIYLTK